MPATGSSSPTDAGFPTRCAPPFPKVLLHKETAPREFLLHVALVTIAVGFLYASVFKGLWDLWMTRQDLSHGFRVPLYEETINRCNSMLCNLRAPLQRKKLQRLHELIARQFDRCSVAFRSGRWGYTHEIARILLELGCRVDTSITPYTSWTCSQGPDFSSYTPHPFVFRATDSSSGDFVDDMVEFPATIGYVGGTFARSHQFSRWLRRPPFRRLRMAGVLARLELSDPSGCRRNAKPRPEW